MNTPQPVKNDILKYLMEALPEEFGLDPNPTYLMELINKFDEHYDLIDIISFQIWAIRNEQSPSWILSTIMHDLTGAETYDPTFSPRTEGYSDVKLEEQ